MTAGKKLTLTDLQLIIRDSLYLSLPGMYWVTAEISEIKENYAGHCYLELVEKNQDESHIRARIKAVIWNKRYSFLKSYFVNITGETLKTGMKILAKAKIDYHEIYGLSLVISDLDPSFTIGELAVKRQMIIRRLEEEGVFTMNREIDIPIVPQKVAIVSSRNAAGYTDFIRHLTGNSYGYAFYTALFDSAMQGEEAEPGIISALDRIASMAGLFDVVVIIRGGGSQTDLSWFDNYNIAYHITQFPLPVITGIGHEKDLSVADMVACRALKTPTAVAGFLIECMNEAEISINDLSQEIKESVGLILDRNRSRLETSRIKLIPTARIMISEIKEHLSGKMLDLVNTGKKYIVRAGLLPADQLSRLRPAAKGYISARASRISQYIQNLRSHSLNALRMNTVSINGFEKTLAALNPENVLGRGYTITSQNGRILKKGAALKKGDVIDTLFSDGTVSSIVKNETGPLKA